MLAVYLSPLYIAFHLYIFRWLLRWMSSCSHHFKKKWIRLVLGLLYLFFAMSFVTAFFMPQCSLKRTVKLIGNYWLGFTLYMAFVIIIADLLLPALKEKQESGSAEASLPPYVRDQRSGVYGFDPWHWHLWYR